MCLPLFPVSRTQSIAMWLLSVLAAFTVKEGTEAESLAIYSVQTDGRLTVSLSVQLLLFTCVLAEIYL